MRRWHGMVVALAAALAASCGGAPEPVALRLLDLFDAATVEQTVDVEPLDPTEWRFDGEGTIAAPEPPDDAEEAEAEDFEDRTATVGWAAYHDVEGLEVRDGAWSARPASCPCCTRRGRRSSTRTICCTPSRSRCAYRPGRASG